MALLEARGVTKRFGGLLAVNKLDLTVEAGAIVSIIGPNGAGKTTFFNTLTGLYRPDEGHIVCQGHSLVGLRPDQIAKFSIARTFQNIRLFANMTVMENILVGMHTRLFQDMPNVLLRSRKFKLEEEQAHARAAELMAFMGLTGVGDELASSLPYGVQRRLEIARSLAADPKLLLLDEPTAGMNPQESCEAMILFQKLRDQLGITILLIEHDMKVVMGISDRITVIDYGEKIAEGAPHEIQSNTRVIEAYLGSGAAAALTNKESEARRPIQLEKSPAPDAGATLLSIENIDSYYGHIHALKGISLEVKAGEIVTLIGANGAGKSTTLRTISGLVRARQGKILLRGQNITKLPPHDIVKAGVGHVPEGRGIFPRLTVRENLGVGAFIINDQPLVQRRMEYVFHLFPLLKERLDQKGGTLSGGEQQMLAIARGLILNPKILLLDEPSMGLAPVLVDLIFQIIEKLNKEDGIAILLVEQNAHMALQYAHRAYVLSTGQIVLQGDAREIAQNPQVKSAYLGG